MMTSATLSHAYRQTLNKFALKTTGFITGVEFQGHDCSMRESGNQFVRNMELKFLHKQLSKW